MITWDDIAELLAFAAVFDQRRADELDIRAWHQVATRQRWTPAAAQRAIVEHYERGAGRRRIDPATISDRLHSLRNQAAASFEAPVIPAELPNRDYPTWYRAQLTAHIDHALERWATTGDEPPRGLPPAPTDRIRTLPELLAAAPEHLRGQMTTATRKIHDKRPQLHTDQPTDTGGDAS